MSKSKLSTKVFRFLQDHEDNAETNVTIYIPELLDASYGLYVWPSAPVLAKYIHHNRHIVYGTHVLELGCGTSLPGIVAAKLGARVTLSDAEGLPLCLERARQSCLLNGLEGVEVIPLTWGRVSQQMVSLDDVDIILGSDCFYEPKDFEPLLATVSFFIAKNPATQFWTTYQIRSADRNIEHLLYKWNLKSRLVPLESFGGDSSTIAGTLLPGIHTIQMIIITHRDYQTHIK